MLSHEERERVEMAETEEMVKKEETVEAEDLILPDFILMLVKTKILTLQV